MTHRIVTLLTLLLFCSIIQAQTGGIAGKVLDAKTGEALMGVAVAVEGTSLGAISDLDGNYKITNVPAGKVNLVFQYVGYSKKKASEIEVKKGETLTLDQNLSSEDIVIKEVAIVASFKRESVSAVNMQLKNGTVIGSAISAEDVKKTPDRNTGDVLRRISGASIQDGKFAVIRGMNDRYNVAMINGAPLPSTEPDRRAFAFDLFPSGMLNNLMVLKSARADLPGDFSGGIIIINTKDIPESNYYNVGFTTGFNTTTTFQPWSYYQGGKTDALGFDDGKRALPDGYPKTIDAVNKFLSTSTYDDRTNMSKLFSNDWAVLNKKQALPNFSGQFTMGHAKQIHQVEIGSVFSASYSNNNKFNDIQRKDFYTIPDSFITKYSYRDRQYSNSVLWGVLWNAAIKIGENHRIRLSNIFNTNSDNQTVIRDGNNYENEQLRKGSLFSFTSNRLYSGQIAGDHVFSSQKIKLNWVGGYSRIWRTVPDLRRTLFTTPDLEDTTYYAVIQSTANPDFFGKFYSKLNESVYSGSLDITVPFQILKNNCSFKAGTYQQYRTRDFISRNIGYVTGPQSSFMLLTLSQDSLFLPQNIGKKGFLIKEETKYEDQYFANSYLNANYAMFDFWFLKRLTINAGVRFEQYHQQVTVFDTKGERKKVVDTTSFDVLPSANIIVAVTEASNVRASVFMGVSRPEFRELAPFSFFDFNTSSSVQGRPDLQRIKTINSDLRYEYYFGKGGQMVAVTGFFKYFKNPIEVTYSQSTGSNPELSWRNAPNAYNLGVEVELRKNLDFLNKAWKGFENFSFVINGAYIYSKVKLNDTISRPLQGQSPYVVNLGVQYNNPKIGLNVSLFYNQIGRRIVFIGSDMSGTTQYNDVYENSRPILDFSVTQRVTKYAEIKLSCSDLIARNSTLYQDINKNGKLDDKDSRTINTRVGRTITIGFSLKF